MKKIPDQTRAQVLVPIRGSMLESQNHRKLRYKNFTFLEKVLAKRAILLYNRYIPIIQEDSAMRTKEEQTAARTQAQAKYDKGHTTGVYMKLNTGTDQDILAWLDRQKSKQGAIKQLIREEIRRTAQ